MVPINRPTRVSNPFSRFEPRTCQDIAYHAIQDPSFLYRRTKFLVLVALLGLLLVSWRYDRHALSGSREQLLRRRAVSLDQDSKHLIQSARMDVKDETEQSLIDEASNSELKLILPTLSTENYEPMTTVADADSDLRGSSNQSNDHVSVPIDDDDDDGDDTGETKQDVFVQVTNPSGNDDDEVARNVHLANINEGGESQMQILGEQGHASSEEVSQDGVRKEVMSPREEMFRRSLEAKQLIADKLKNVYNRAWQNPTYQHHNDAKQRESTNLSCNQEDAFEGIPIDGGGKSGQRFWMPPGGYPIESYQTWEKAYESSLQKIKTREVGGEELREFAKSEVRALRLLRHELFCRKD